MPASKFQKAKKASKVGRYHRTFAALWGKLGGGLISSSTSANLANLIDLMYDQNQMGHNQGYRDAKA